MGKYLLGIDNGSTLSKAALFDLHGREIAVASCKADTEYPHPGWTERSMEMLWGSTASAIRAVLERDIPMIQGVVVVTTVIVLLMNLLVDLAYGWLNPKVRAQ